MKVSTLHVLIERREVVVRKTDYSATASKEAPATADDISGLNLDSPEKSVQPDAAQSDNVTQSSSVQTRFFDNEAAQKPQLEYTHIRLSFTIRT